MESKLDLLRKALNRHGMGRFGIHPLVSEIVFQYTIMNKLNNLEECKVRVYALEGFNFAAHAGIGIGQIQVRPDQDPAPATVDPNQVKPRRPWIQTGLIGVTAGVTLSVRVLNGLLTLLGFCDVSL